MFKLVRTLALCAGLLLVSASAAMAGGPHYEVTITNLTKGQVISPPVIAVHRSSFRLFEPGGSPSEGLRALAEDGVTDILAAELEANRGVGEVAVADGPIPPGESRTLIIRRGHQAREISAVGMLVSTNDGFFALSGQRLPWRRVTRDAQVYDAGSEANTEACTDLPGPPCGSPFVTPDAEPEGFIHIHNGVHGVGDLEPALRDWRGPAARVTIQRVP
jgi:hypothetical protein